MAKAALNHDAADLRGRRARAHVFMTAVDTAGSTTRSRPAAPSSTPGATLPDATG